MSELDLEVIKREYDMLVAGIRDTHYGAEAYSSALWERYREDTPALIAEIERLRNSIRGLDSVEPACDTCRLLQRTAIAIIGEDSIHGQPPEQPTPLSPQAHSHIQRQLEAQTGEEVS